MNPNRYNSIMFRYLLIGFLLFTCSVHATDEAVEDLTPTID